MAKKIVKKRKLKLFNFFVGLLILIGLSFCGYCLFQISVKNLVIKGTNYLNDDYVLELAGVKNYPRFLMINNKKVARRLEESSYIDRATVKKKWFFALEIAILENRPVIYDTSSEKFIFSNYKAVKDEEISQSFRVPRLLNYVPDSKYKRFIKGMSNVRNDTLSKISDIEYQPNDYDKDRFLLYMDDGNMVYLTLTKFDMINHYNEVLSQLENHKGILYLDNGNHFQIKE